jgi:hypothetical protein
LKANLQRIRDNLAPDAYFIDVWSSARPYDYWTADGQFHTAVSTRDTWGKLFAWIRDYLGHDAPQISESGHDQLIGWLDGAQTNHLRVGKSLEGSYGWCVWDWPCADAERTPWFDAAHHDRFILHGAGYSSRYQGGLDGRLHGIDSDDYMATEVLTGHPGMVSRPFGRNVVRKYWLLSDLMRALALKTIESVEYVDGDLHRQHVHWSGGGQVWVNRGASDWTVAGNTLPEFGFLARVPTEAGPVEASIARRGGRIVETATSPQRLYVNGRQLVDPRVPIRLSVEELKHSGGRALEMTLRWQADVPIPAGWVPFLHFCDPAGEIAFQAQPQPGAFADNAEGTIEARATATVPDELRPGSEYELCYGLYNRSTGARLTLAGPDVGDRRIRLGKIRLDGNGETLEQIAWQPQQPTADPYLARQNPDGQPIDFGPLETPGGCRLHLEGETLVVTPLPGDRAPEFALRLRWSGLPWKLPRPTHAESIGEDGRVLDRATVAVDGEIIEIACKPGVFQYRLGKN